MSLCLNMIVRDEAAVVERCLASAAPYIDRFVVCDTGSKDDTPGVVRRFFEARGISGEVPFFPFESFGQARNRALELARVRCAPTDYLLLADADMELVVEDPDALKKLDRPSYHLTQRQGSLHYPNPRILRADAPARYVGSTHEYLTVPMAPAFEGAYFIDHDDGGCKADKYERDVRLLLADLATDPNDARAMFYLAQTYHCLGRYEEAVHWYSRRADRGGWDEEVWFSRYAIARSLAAMDEARLDKSGGRARLIGQALVAYGQRPSRVEPLHLIARYLREKGDTRLANVVLAEALKISVPKEGLFLETSAYSHGVWQEHSICGFYSPEPSVRESARRTCFDLSVDSSAPAGVRDTAISNSVHYAPLLREAMPSADMLRLRVPQEDAVFVSTNPSVAADEDGTLMVNVRLVNYSVPTSTKKYEARDPEGRVRTRNVIAALLGTDRGLSLPRSLVDGCPAEYPKSWIVGYEDVRLFRWRGGWWSTATACDRNAEGRGEIVLLELSGVALTTDPVVARVVRQPVLSESGWEKNWMPLVRGEELLFVYQLDPTTVLRVDPKSLIAEELGDRHEPEWDLRRLRGSSQAISWREEGRLLVAHEAHDGEGGRRYLHRFVELGADLRVRRISDPFRFLHTGIEFCAGAAIAGGRLYVSFGYEDREAWIASVEVEEVERFIDQSATQ